ncbi:MAG: YtxH domain-containing protein [Bacteroidales bacterium]|nr:YtxH domain-containing protein [Bacteroidales bacterium]
MKGFTNGLLFGALIGGAIALLFAPKTGAETREVLKDKINKAKEELEKKKKELEEMEQKLRSQADEPQA